MSFVRLYTTPTQTPATCYTYETIWDVSIDANSLIGATFYQQESRTASFTMPYDTIFDIEFLSDPAKPAIYRAVCEIWEYSVCCCRCAYVGDSDYRSAIYLIFYIGNIKHIILW